MCCSRPCCLAFSGFAQFVGCVLLLVLASTSLSDDQGRCVLTVGSRGESALCAVIETLGLITIFAALVLSVLQGLVASLCGPASVLCVEMFGRSAIAVSWLVVSVLASIFGAGALRHHEASPGAIAVVVATCWVLFVFSLLMAAADVAVAACCCAYCCCSPGNDMLWTISQLLCLTWLVEKITGRPRPCPGHHHPYPYAGPPGAYSHYPPGGPGVHEPLLGHDAHTAPPVMYPAAPGRPVAPPGPYGPPQPPVYYTHSMYAPFAAEGVPVAPTAPYAPSAPSASYPAIYPTSAEGGAPSSSSEAQQRYPNMLPEQQHQIPQPNKGGAPSAPPMPRG